MQGKCDGCGRIGTVVYIPMEGIYCPLCEAIILVEGVRSEAG
jgi:ribosomal protein S27E